MRPDWEPAVEWTQFYYARRGELPFCSGGAASIQPLWDRTEGEPNLRGFRVLCESDGRRPVAAEFPNKYFAGEASEVADELVKRGKIESGDTYLYRPIAYPRNGDKPEAEPVIDVVEETPAVELAESPLEDFRRRAAPAGVVDVDDMPVFIPRHVLDEAAALTRQNEGTETGGVLIGRLYRDASLPEIFAEVTAQIPAQHAPGTAAKLSFTPATWSAADAAVRLRNRGEKYLGYWHSHPVREWCKAKECTLEKQKTCRLGKDFFSEDDRGVMRAAFPRAYSVGLVVNDTAFTDLSFSLFGWREGTIHPRGYYVLEEPNA
jgi:hypothetical protein